MTSTQVRSEAAPKIPVATAMRVDMKLEVVVLPVSEVERAKRFYAGLGWRLDGDFSKSEDSTWASFSDPDGNGWLLQEITTRLPGRT